MARPLARWLTGIGLVIAMLAFGIGVYHAAGYLKGNRPTVRRPTETSAQTLPGTIYLVQAGAIYRFQRGTFTQITADDGWTQPAAAPGGHELVVVRRELNYSDLYLLNTTGRQASRLTNNAATGAPAEYNHWAFYPRFSADGSSIYYAYDAKDPYNGYRVDLEIVAVQADGSSRVPAQWTDPNQYTGGDVNPAPLQGGGLIYAKYSIDDSFQVHVQVWMQRRAGSVGVALTTPDVDCGQPALSADQKLIAMVCTKGSNQTADLEVASFDPTSLTLGAPTTLVSGQLINSPAFSPDGKSIAYLAPATTGGAFQLWTVNSTGAASPRDITTDLGLDSTSAPVWVAG